MYIETSTGAINSKAEMWSSWYWSSGQHCVQFFYHMFGDQIGTLTVLASYSGSRIRYIKFNKQGNQNDTWIMGRVPINRKGWFRVSQLSLEYTLEAELNFLYFCIFFWKYRFSRGLEFELLNIHGVWKFQIYLSKLFEIRLRLIIEISTHLDLHFEYANSKMSTLPFLSL